jgi:hypothetical protein
MTLSGRPLQHLAVIAIAAGPILSCDPPIDPEQDSRIVAENVATVFESAARAIRGVEGEGATSARRSTARGMDRLAASLLGGDEVRSPEQPPRATSPMQLRLRSGLHALRRMLVAPVDGPEATLDDRRPAAPIAARRTDPGPTIEPAPTDDDIAMSAAEVRRAIQDRLLAKGNLESTTAGEAIYRLRAEVTCADPDDGRLDPDCERFLRQVELRVSLSRAGVGYDLGVLVGPQRVRPVGLLVSERSLQASTDLAVLKEAALEIARALEEKEPDLPTVMRGRVLLSLSKEGVRQAALSLGLLDMIEIRVEQERSAFRTAAAEHAFSLYANGETGVLTATADVGLTEVVTPLDDSERRPTPSPDLRVVVAGLHGRGIFDAGNELIRFEGLAVGPGPSFAEVRGDRIIELNLNPADGRTFDATVTFTPEGLPRLALSPRFDLSLMFKLGLIAAELDQLGSPAPAHLLDETYRLQLDAAGGKPPVVQAREHSDGGGLELVSGRLMLSSSRVPEPVTVEAGQCVYPREPAPDQHPVLGAINVTSCQP